MALASALGTEIAARGHRLVYGGGGLGLMGAVARGAHEAGGDVLGIIPDFLKEAEKTLTIVEHIFVPDMHARKIRMYTEADAFIVLPGGVGTLEEAVEVLSWSRMNLHAKPVIFLSDTGFWDKMIGVFDAVIAEGFAPESFSQDAKSTHDIADCFDLIDQGLAQPLDHEFQPGPEALA